MAPSQAKCRLCSCCTAAAAAAAAGSVGTQDVPLAFVPHGVSRSATQTSSQGAAGRICSNAGLAAAGTNAARPPSLGHSPAPSEAVIISLTAASLAAASATPLRRRRGGRVPRARRAAEAASVISPFKADVGALASEAEGTSAEAAHKPKLALTLENVELILDEVRPYLRSDGGDCKVVEIDDTIVRVELQGACTSCSASSVTLKTGIERSLQERIPEITEVVAVMPDQEQLSSAGVEEVLDGIRPFLSVSGGTIEMHEIEDGQPPKVVLKMAGPPLKSMAVRVEVVNRIKRKYPQVQDVDIVSGEEFPTSA